LIGNSLYGFESKFFDASPKGVATDRSQGRSNMRLTTKGRFAVTAMIDLGLRSHHGPVTLASISQRQGISLSYLEQLFGKLRRHELVESTRGPGGGYTVGKSMADISVADIIYAVDEPLDATQCGGKENCGGEDQRCMTHDLWANLNRVMVDYLDSVSLQHLVDEQRARMARTGGSVVLQDNRRAVAPPLAPTKQPAGQT
jgi:Rrf2 family transcriptional regulator, iron-sulfur cluster assembly transcription factor